MSASRTLRTAHFLMFIGVAPMALAAAYAMAVISAAQNYPWQGAANDAFVLIALLLFGYVSTLVLGGTGAVWSWVLTRRRLPPWCSAYWW